MEQRENDPFAPAGELLDVRPIRLHFKGLCAGCGTRVPAGDRAVHEVGARRVWCLACIETAREARDATAAEAAEIGDGDDLGDGNDLGEPDGDDLDHGVAGGSALREFERRVARREARLRERFGNRLGGLVIAVTREPDSTRAWARGAEGESVFARALEGVRGVVVLHDRAVPGTRANIDHVVIATPGVFVVDAKRYRGLVEVRDVGGWFRTDHRLYVGGRDRSTLADAMGWQAEAIRGALPAIGESVVPVTSVLCFVDGEWPLFGRARTFRGVRLESPKSLRGALTAPALLSEATIADVAAALARALPSKR